MKKQSKKENSHNFIQQEEQAQQKYYDMESKILKDHTIIKDILEETSVLEDSQTQKIQEESFLDHLVDEVATTNIVEFGVQEDSANINQIEEHEQQKPQEKEIDIQPDMVENQIKYQDLEEGENTSAADISPYTTIPSADNDSQGVFSLTKGTKRAVFVLKDVFGDTAFDSELLAEYGVSTRKKIPCLFLAIIFGFFGIHRLYLGHYTKVPLYIFMVCFYWASSNILPDRGLAILISIIILLWIIADVLAIIFSKRIKDGDGKILEQWL